MDRASHVHRRQCCCKGTWNTRTLFWKVNEGGTGWLLVDRGQETGTMCSLRPADKRGQEGQEGTSYSFAWKQREHLGGSEHKGCLPTSFPPSETTRTCWSNQEVRLWLPGPPIPPEPHMNQNVTVLWAENMASSPPLFVVVAANLVLVASLSTVLKVCLKYWVQDLFQSPPQKKWRTACSCVSRKQSHNTVLILITSSRASHFKPD